MSGSYNLGTAEGTIKINYDGSGSSKRAVTDVENVGKSGDKTNESLNKLGNTSLAAGLAISAGLAYATNKAVDFEKEVSNIGAVSGASQSQLDQLRKKALQLGADTSFSASEAASAMEELAKAGVSTTDILNGAADATVALAAAGGVDLATAATISSNAMNQFGLTAQQLPKIVDQIAGAANTSAIDVTDLGQSMSQVGAVAHLAGLSFQDTATAIAEMGNAGIKGSDAGTSLKTFLQNLIPTTKQQIELMKQLGIVTSDGANHFFDASGKVKSLADVSQVLQTAIKGMSKEQQLNTLQTLFGTDAIRAAAVFADQGATGFNNMAAAIDKTKAADVATARLNNTAGKIEQLKGSVETLAIQIGEALLPRLTSLASNLTGIVNWFTQLSPAIQTTIVTIVSVAGSLLLLVAATIKIYNAVKAFMAIWEALNLEFLFSPIGLVIIAIVALVAAFVLLWQHSEAFRNFWKGLWADIWGFLKTIGAWFAGPFANFFIDTWNKIWGFFKAVGAWFAGPFAGFFKSMWSVLSGIFNQQVAFFKSIWDAIVAGAQFVWSIVSPIIGFFAPLFRATFGLIVSITQLAWSIITAIFQVAIAIIRPIFEAWLTGMRILWTAVWDALKLVAIGFWEGLKAIIIPVINFVWAAIQFWLSTLKAFWETIWGALKFAVLAVWGWIGPYVTTAITVIVSAIRTWLSVLQAFWSGIWNGIKFAVSAVWSAILALITNARNNIVAVIDGIKVIVDKVRGFFNQLKDAASGGVGSLISFVAGIPGRVIGAIGNLGSLLYNSGQKIIQGLIDGISSMIGKVTDAVGNVLSKARNLLPFSPAKEGPFSGKGWSLYSGQAISDALAAGITGHADRAVQATYRLVSSVNAVASPSTNPIAAQFAYAAPGGSGGSTVVNNTTINAPAPLVDPRALADYMLRKLNTSVTTRSIPTTTAK
jgi:TP901 family phage tail tape measure protein